MMLNKYTCFIRCITFLLAFTTNSSSSVTAFTHINHYLPTTSNSIQRSTHYFVPNTKRVAADFQQQQQQYRTQESSIPPSFHVKSTSTTTTTTATTTTTTTTTTKRRRIIPYDNQHYRSIGKTLLYGSSSTTNVSESVTTTAAVAAPFSSSNYCAAWTQRLFHSLFRYSGRVPFWQALGINAILFSALRGKLLRMLTPSGFVHAMTLGTLLWTTLGWRGWTYCVAYLFLGQLVTKIRFAEKEKLGIAEKRGGRRGPENVWGSAFTGLICSILSVWGKHNETSFLGIPSHLYVLGYVASLSTKLADTFASEIGKAYGKTTFLITTLQSVPPGTEGAVSLEGTIAAFVGGLLLSLFGWLGLGLIESPRAVAISTIAAFFATNMESVLGATLQEKDGLQWMTNEVVNFINTLIGAMVAIYAGKLFLS